jgi:hypothetical protein
MDHFGLAGIELRSTGVGPEKLTVVGVEHPGVLYRCENKGVARKGICNCMKAMKLKIDDVGRGICKLMILKGGE